MQSGGAHRVSARRNFVDATESRDFPSRRCEDETMFTVRSMLVPSLITGALFASTATKLRADDRTLFTWSGTVDREVVIVMRGADLDTQGDGFGFARDARFRVNDALPRSAGSVSIQRADGRGDVEVIEQPSLFNGYTTRVRVRDRQSGADQYRLVVTWNGVDPYDRNDRRDRDDNDRRRRDDDRWDRRDRDRDERGGRRDAGVLRWSGAVDDVAEIRIRGRRVDYYSRSGRPLYNVRSDVRGAGLPDYAVPLDLRRLSGRGNVSIVQYPREWNGWTAIIRVNDSRSGADGYDIDLRW